MAPAFLRATRGGTQGDRRFADRREAGRALGRMLAEELGDQEPIVLGLPRGGVPVAYEVARALGAPLDVFVVRKLGVPWQEELAMGAIASGGVRVVNEQVVESAGIRQEHLEQVAEREAVELERREQAYRDGRPPVELGDRLVVVVDDGLATGSSMEAAVVALRRRGVRRIVVAVPVGSPETCARFEREVEAIVCAEKPASFRGVGQWYEDFSPTEDEEVRELLRSAWSGGQADAPER